jgi:hypothetical protein
VSAFVVVMVGGGGGAHHQEWPQRSIKGELIQRRQLHSPPTTESVHGSPGALRKDRGLGAAAPSPRCSAGACVRAEFRMRARAPRRLCAAKPCSSGRACGSATAVRSCGVGRVGDVVAHNKTINKQTNKQTWASGTPPGCFARSAPISLRSCGRTQRQGTEQCPPCWRERYSRSTRPPARRLGSAALAQRGRTHLELDLCM